MRFDPVIDFAQERFGDDGGFPDDEGAFSLPEGLAERVAEVIILAENEQQVSIENGAGPVADPEPLPDGTTPDNLAYYLPFHFYRARWGIYIRASGMWSLAQRLAANRPDINALNHARIILLEHERLHFMAEYAASRIEVVTAQSSYRPYFSDRIGAPHEEALANAKAIVQLKRYAPSAVVAAANKWMRLQPAGYREFEQWLPPKFIEGQRRAAAFMNPSAATTNLILSNRPGFNSKYAAHPADFLFRLVPLKRVPLYFVMDASVSWMRIIKPFPKEFGIQVKVHTNDHKPPHIHIDCPPGTERTRYRWPDLSPLHGYPALASREEKRLGDYLAKYRAEIDNKIQSVPWY
jgi:hypothetical protein